MKSMAVRRSQFHDQVGVRRYGALTGNNRQLSGHPQVEGEMPFLVEAQDNPFSPSGKSLDPPSYQSGSPLGIVGAAKFLLTRPNRGDPTSHERRTQVPHNGFNLPKLRH